MVIIEEQPDMERILVFGGSFDPVHNAHLALANRVLELTQAQRCLWVPCKKRVFDKKQQASAKQRLDMLHIALKNHGPKHQISDIEVKRQTPSFTYLTIEELKISHPHDTWFGFIMGSDNFMEFQRWHAYDKFHTLCNIVIFQRGEQNEIAMRDIAKSCGFHFTNDLAVFLSHDAGYIYYIKGDYPSASSRVREAIACKQQNIPDLDPLVQAYIQQEKLYQRIVL